MMKKPRKLPEGLGKAQGNRESRKHCVRHFHTLKFVSKSERECRNKENADSDFGNLATTKHMQNTYVHPVCFL